MKNRRKGPALTPPPRTRALVKRGSVVGAGAAIVGLAVSACEGGPPFSDDAGTIAPQVGPQPPPPQIAPQPVDPPQPVQPRDAGTDARADASDASDAG
jgi:hypothetical protein